MPENPHCKTTKLYHFSLPFQSLKPLGKYDLYPPAMALTLSAMRQVRERKERRRTRMTRTITPSGSNYTGQGRIMYIIHGYYISIECITKTLFEQPLVTSRMAV